MSIFVRVDEHVYLKDPERTKLGKKIIGQGIHLIDEIGLEKFTFKKLSKRIESTEASVYRYFENKHMLLMYLVSWYWNWIEYKIRFETHNLKDPAEQLQIAIRILSEPIEADANFGHIDEKRLYHVVVSESAKAYLTKKVDEENSQGYFATYKNIVDRVACFVNQINPEYAYPKALISSVIEAAHTQKYFAEHLPKLTEITLSDEDSATNFLLDLIFKVIK